MLKKRKRAELFLTQIIIIGKEFPNTATVDFFFFFFVIGGGLFCQGTCSVSMNDVKLQQQGCSISGQFQAINYQCLNFIH